MLDEAMSEQPKPVRTGDSLDNLELMMAIDESIGVDPTLTPAQRERLIHEINERVERGEFGDMGDLGDDALGILVRKLGPRGPLGQAGAAAKPEETL
jgi:hypothetical protein